MFYSPITLSVTIPAGLAVSSSVTVHGLQLLELLSPPGWTAASLSFQGSIDGASWFNIHAANGDEIVINCAANRLYRLNSLDGAGALGGLLPFGLRLFRVRSGTAAAPVNQGANRTFVITARQTT